MDEHQRRRRDRKSFARYRHAHRFRRNVVFSSVDFLNFKRSNPMRVKNIVLTGVAVLASAEFISAGPGGGTVDGKVTYEGTPAKQKPIDMSKEPSCAQQHPTPITTETVVTGPGNALENVVVYISAGAPDEPAPAQAAVFEQKGCQYIPHVLALRVNQELKVLNDDQTSHNIHPLA